MLIEFRVENFRSIREEQVLSLVASNSDKTLRDECVIDRSLPGMSKLRYLKGAALYGANASGKSNVIEAIRFLGDFVKNSATEIKPGDPTGVEPFKLDRDSGSKPSCFEITFVADDVRYQFGMALTTERVVEEYLIAYPKGAAQRWYERVFDEEKGEYEWSGSKTSFDLDTALVGKTRENSLFLSVAPQFNHPQLMPVSYWFRKYLRVLRLGAGSRPKPFITLESLTKPESRDRIVGLLRDADVGVTAVEVREREMSLDDLGETIPKPIQDAVLKAMNEKMSLGTADRITQTEWGLVHRADRDAPIVLDFDEEESAGTRRIFSLAGPWIDILDNGYTVVIDEIETSLHPLLVKGLLKTAFSSEKNPENAQIIFTTHNPLLLDQSLMRRDQIWFTEKAPTGATQLYPLTDYRPRKDEAWARGYLAGRYGAIPSLGDGLDL